MRGIDAAGVFGAALLVAGLIFLALDPKLFDHWYDWIFGPFFWLMGCALIIAWAIGRMEHMLRPRDKAGVKAGPGRRDAHV